jgi:hypothetical protein
MNYVRARGERCQCGECWYCVVKQVRREERERE